MSVSDWGRFVAVGGLRQFIAPVVPWARRFDRGERICAHCGRTIWRVTAGPEAGLWHASWGSSDLDTSLCWSLDYWWTSHADASHEPRVCTFCDLDLGLGEAMPILPTDAREGRPGHNWVCVDESACWRRQQWRLVTDTLTSPRGWLIEEAVHLFHEPLAAIRAAMFDGRKP